MKSDTLFVIGAGASFEVGLPLGRDLKSTISRLLKIEHDRQGYFHSGDQNILETLMRWPGEETSNLQKKCVEIANAIHLFDSIDDLIDSRSDDEKFAKLGKIAIVKAILDAEKKSALYFDSNRSEWHPEFEKKRGQKNFPDSYLPRLWSIIRSNVKRDGLDHLFDGVGFVIFNYDRCLEHFLYHAVQTAYRVPGDVAAELISQVPIIHPYGTAGTLPWQSGVSAHVDFGAENFDLLSLAPNIKTYTERIDTTDLMAMLRTTVQRADTIVFLGMAFHEQNMDLLALEGMDGASAHRVFGTVYGLSESHQLIAERLIERTLGRSNDRFGWFSLEQSSCAQLLDEYGKLLTYGHLEDLAS